MRPVGVELRRDTAASPTWGPDDESGVELRLSAPAALRTVQLG